MPKVTKEYLYEIAFCRPILIILLVLYHSFVIYTGVWDMPRGVASIPVYAWVADIAYSFMLPMFFFISGYVWGWQCRIKGSQEPFMVLLKKKFQRLYLPCLFFGIFYLAIFEKEQSLWRNVYTLISGAGHLWFLPVLLGCFVVSWLLYKKGLKGYRIWIPLLSLSLLSDLSFWPQRLADVLFYLPFFWGGATIQKERDKVDRSLSPYVIIVMWLVYLLVYIVLHAYVIPMISGQGGEPMVWKNMLMVLCKSLYAWVGVMVMYKTAVSMSICRQMPNWYVKCGVYSMGVYIFQQFIIKFLYYKLDVSVFFSSYMLPWIVFLLALSLSFLCVYTFKQIRL